MALGRNVHLRAIEVIPGLATIITPTQGIYHFSKRGQILQCNILGKEPTSSQGGENDSK